MPIESNLNSTQAAQASPQWASNSPILPVRSSSVARAFLNSAQTAEAPHSNSPTLPGRSASLVRVFLKNVRGFLKNRLEIIAALSIWLPAVVFGFSSLQSYSTTPGNPGSPPLHWPKYSPIKQIEDRADILMFLHPQCSCSRATVSELEIVMAESKRRVSARVYFYLLENDAASWAAGDLWRTVSRIPGVHPFVDPGAAMAGTFGVFTSGQTLLYGTDGQLLFRGGITPFRGHSGENAGRTALTALLSIDARRINAHPRREQAAEASSEYGPTPSFPFAAIAPLKTLPVISPVLGCSLRGER